MQATGTRITELMEGSKKQFHIPVYQRAYSWKQKDCDTLFMDLLTVHDKHYKNHFFGSVVYMRKEDDYTVIDGQQRITTVSLLLLAIRNYIRDKGLEKECGIHSDQIFYSYIIHQYEDDDSKRVRLCLIDSDQEAYRCLIDDMDPIEGCCITVNYKNFLKKLSELNSEEIKGVYDAIGKLVIVQIGLDIEKGDDPQLIFESLNSTGLALTEADKVRNFVLMNMEAKKQDAAYKKYWIPIEKNTPNGDMTDFIRYYLAVKTRTLFSNKKVYTEFKHYNYDNDFDMKDILQDMLVYSKYYKVIMTPSASGSQCEKALYRFRRFEANTPIPILMDIFKAHADGLLDDNEQCEAIAIIESWLLRREVCGLETKSLNKIFVYLGYEVAKYLDAHEASWLDVMKYFILAKKGKSRYPNDHDFNEKFVTYELYNAKATIRKYILERLENYSAKEKIAVEEQLDNGELTIEHVMPQKVTPAWKEILGDRWEYIHTKYKDTPGNLTLTAYNSEYSNMPFVEKKNMKDKGFSYSKLNLNRDIKQATTWGEDQIKARANMLCEDAKKIWPNITSTIAEPDENNWIEWDDDFDFTNVNVSKIKIIDDIKSTKDVTDAYKKINSILYGLDPVGYVEYVSRICNQDKIRKPFKLSNIVSIELNLSSQGKIAFIKKLCKSFDLKGKDVQFMISPNFDVKNENTYGELKIGALARKLVEALLKENKLSDDEIKSLMTKEYSHNLFKSLHYPLLAKSMDDNKGKSSHKRYYKESVEVQGCKVYISSQWFEKERDVLIGWYNEHMKN